MSAAAQGNFVGYDSVTELSNTNGLNGKIISTYVNNLYESDYSISGIPVVEDPRNGNLLSETTYNQNGDTVSKVINTYEWYYPAREIIKGIVYETYPFLSLPGEEINNSYYFKTYNVYSDWHRLLSTSTTDYTPAGNMVNVVDYVYNGDNKLIAKETRTLHDTTQIITRYKYATDYNSTAGAIYASMVGSNLVNPPVEVQSWRKKGAVEKLVASKITEYKSFAGKFISPYKSYKLKTTEPLTTTEVGAGSGTSGPFSSLLFNSSYFELENTFNYNPAGNVVSQQNPSDVVKIYLWDYNSAYPIAECINADSSSIAYTSFEADGKGGWSFSGSVSSDATSPTGKKCYNTGNGDITKSGLTNTTYIVSYWGKTGSVNVNSAGPARTGKTIGSWTYYEHEITGTSITVSGNKYIDELRLYPKGALMTTYTYNPLIGAINQCDANNRITYYQYDSFGRLKLIKDEDGNILKRVDYKYQSTYQQ